jgi:glyoxylase-like metal-dependent hydrolase (beta-lactamase superfamily II)
MSYEIERFVVTDFEANCYLLHDPEGNAIVVDPGGEGDRILDAVRRKNLSVRLILNTHGHFDHAGANAQIRAATGAALAIHSDDAPMLADGVLCGALLFGYDFAPVEPDRLLGEGDTVGCGEMNFEVLHTPGHTPGSASFLDRANARLFSGDFVFRGAVGRWDLPGGSEEALMRALRQKLLVLPDNTTVFSGHGEMTTVGHERRTNPFLVGLG